MSWLTADGARIGQPRAELESLMAGTAFAPARARAFEARELLERDGAVILCGLPPQVDSLVLAAAEVLGTRLSRLYPVRERRSDRESAPRPRPAPPGRCWRPARSCSSTTTGAGTGATGTTPPGWSTS